MRCLKEETEKNNLKSKRNKRGKGWMRRKAKREGPSLEQHLVSYWGVTLEVSPEEIRQFDPHGSFARQVFSNGRDGLKRRREWVKLSWESYTDQV